MTDDDTIDLLARGYTREQIAALRMARATATSQPDPPREQPKAGKGRGRARNT